MALKIMLLVLLLEMITLCLANYNNPIRWSNKLNVQEKDYLNWVRKLPSVKHSLFQEAKNKHKPCLTIKVSKKKRKSSSSRKMFNSVQSAINSLPLVNTCRVRISVGPGTYREKVEIPETMRYITMEGARVGKTVIEWDDTVDTQPLGTYGSATFAVNSPYFLAKNITFKNTAGAQGKQAVALRISADTAAFIGCKFIGLQDTLYDHKGRHYFKDCYIQGSVDFIFGNGLSLYHKCHLHATAGRYGALTAQKRESMLEDTGFSFVKCKVTGSGVLYLGRAWGTFSRVVFAYTFMEKIITPRGWYDWGDKNRRMTVFYGQYKCSGAGANNGGRVPWARELTKQEVQPFISMDFIDGHQWLPKSLHTDS